MQGSEAMSPWPKPPEGSWTQHYSGLGTEAVSYEDSISPEFYALEREAIFKRAWLNVGRVEQLPRKGSYFTKEIHVAGTSLVIVRGDDERVRALLMVSFPVECWRQPHIPDSGAAAIECLVEPGP
jgi:hypothetical protein